MATTRLLSGNIIRSTTAAHAVSSLQRSFSTKITKKPKKVSHLNAPVHKWHGLSAEHKAHFNVLTFNLLAPCYKRLEYIDVFTKRPLRESRIRNIWFERAQKTLDFFQKEVYAHDDLIALQEFWLDDSYSLMMHRDFAKHGYDVHVLPRSEQKLDAVVFLVRHSVFETRGMEVVPLLNRGPNDAPRVALLLWLQHRETGKNLAVANTHLSFPHSAEDKMKQESQMHKLIVAMDEFVLKNDIFGCSQMVMGDFNVELKSSVCKQLRSAGYYSTFEVSPPEYAPPDEKRTNDYEVPIAMYKTLAPSKNRFISHLTHHLEEVGCDHIFVTAESRDVERLTHTYVGQTHVLPRKLPFENWCDTFMHSDHRPVRSEVIFAPKTQDL